MNKHIKKLDFTGQSIFIGIDTGIKSWGVSIMSQEFEHKTFHTSPKVDYWQLSEPTFSRRNLQERLRSGLLWILDP